MTRDFIINAIEDSEGCPFPEIPCPLHADCKKCIEKGLIDYENDVLNNFIEWCKMRGYACYDWRLLIEHYRKEIHDE